MGPRNLLIPMAAPAKSPLKLMTILHVQVRGQLRSERVDITAQQKAA